ncbi:MAG: CPBP family intramembrane metalloprotease [Acidimicrobiia bacterium]|nr:CPBP family intramembrane metalloprotease [Acidimicrobiia bacterium]
MTVDIKPRGLVESTEAGSSELAVYLLLAFGVTFALTAPIAASEQGWIATDVGSEWHGVGALGPLVGALVVAKRSSLAAAHLRQGIGRWRVSPWFWLAALSPLVFLVPAAFVARLVDGERPAWSALADSDRLAGGGWMTALLIPALAYGIGEEAGWRGVVLPRLQSRFQPLPAALVLGGIWVAWHIPFYLYREGMVDAALGEQIAQAVVIVIGGLFLAWLYNSTGGSILLCAVWHFSHSVVHVAAPEISQNFDTVNGVFSTVLAICVAAIWWRRMSVNQTVTFPGETSLP